MRQSPHKILVHIRFTLLLLIFFTASHDSCLARDFGWGDLLNFSYLPDLTPYDLQWESGATRIDAQSKPVLRRNERNQVILLEATGPGMLVRYYSSPSQVKIYFFVDDSPQPFVSGKLCDLFFWYYEVENPMMKGEPEPTQTSPLLWPVAEKETGVISLAPIFFAKSLKVVSDEPIVENNYEFNWIRLQANIEKSNDESRFQKEVVSRWRHPGEREKREGNLREIRGSSVLRAGQSVTLCKIDGAGTIVSLRITLDPSNPMLERQLILRCWWDGNEKPSVQVPLGDLCGRQWGQGRPGLLGLK